MAYDPMSFFKIGQAVGKSRRSAMGMSTDNLWDQFKTSQKQDYLGKTFGTELIKNSMMSPLEQARLKQINEGKDVYIADTRTGEVEQTGTVPQNARVFAKNQFTGTESSQLSGIDQMLQIMDRMEGQLISDPNLPVKKDIPFMAREYKADHAFLRRLVALESGGKNLTGIEKTIVNENLPDEQDIFNMAAMQRKFNNLRNVFKGTKARLGGEEFGAQRADTAPDASTTSNSEDAMIAEALSKMPQNRKAILALYKQRNQGREYGR